MIGKYVKSIIFAEIFINFQEKLQENVDWYLALLWTPEAFPGPNLRFPRKASVMVGSNFNIFIILIPQVLLIIIIIRAYITISIRIEK